MLFAINATLVALVAIMTLLPLSRYPAWWVRDMDFPRLQIVIFALSVLLFQWLVLGLEERIDRVLNLVTLACLIYQLFWILPYTRIFPSEVKVGTLKGKGERIRILSSNVLEPNRNAQGLIDLIRQNNPDVVVTLETNHWWQEQLSVLEKDYPYTIKCPLENLYGMHVFSRYPLEDCATQFLVQPDIPSMHAMLVLPSQRRIRLHFLHPAPPSPTENDESTQRDAELLIVAKSVTKLDTPVIVAGDLNDVAWSATTRLFRKISGLLDPRVGRGMFNTFHAGHWFMRWPLDHFFHSSHFTLSFIKRLPAFGSDHFPVMVELIYDESAVEEQEGLSANAHDMEISEEKIHAEPVSPEKVHEPH
ncbi:endonuclease/exonuclease/phosphatase family protein [Oxalobacteraceae bacterium R-40]|uniref:Endonuclease/exonuclease/phosphatase family protein n=1 Tax=Keguizhuia sedimenti TaxID=3064264 RepID=A0ABU1BWG0_9BURK|nr:endonuclease/exonuclease/phosphatase family protein [Oxalobacteraceae bacterium R-40]